MAETSIEWTHGPNGERGFTFNPWWICAEVSPACDECYARTFAHRLGYAWGVDAPRRFFGNHYWAQPVKWNALAERRGERYRVFCASMADVFDNDPTVVPHRERLWPLVRATPHLDWLFLTKRIGNAKRMLPSDWGDGYPNAWLGATIANQEEADRDVIKLLTTPARIHFLSCEPLLGPIDLARLKVGTVAWDKSKDAGGGSATGDLVFNALQGSKSLMVPALDWVIAGGESGGRARASHVTWFRSLRDQSVNAGVAFLLKQWGEWIDHDQPGVDMLGTERSRLHEWPDQSASVRLGRRATGRHLDGRTWDESPIIENIP